MNLKELKNIKPVYELVYDLLNNHKDEAFTRTDINERLGLDLNANRLGSVLVNIKQFKGVGVKRIRKGKTRYIHL